MSCWHLPSFHMSVVRNGLVRFYGEAKATKLAKSFAKMNTNSMLNRYGDRLKTITVDLNCKYEPNDKALLNMLQCINYQNDCASGCEKIQKNLEDAINAVALKVPDETLDTSTPWCLDSESDAKNRFSHCITRKEAHVAQA
jgi:hypothetical protein